MKTALVLLGLALVLFGFFSYVYWLIASWLVDSVMGFQGFEGFAVKLTFVLMIMALVAAINNLGKAKED